MLLIVYVSSLLLEILLLFHEAESAPQFNIKPEPSFVLEGQNTTLVWSYTLSGTLRFASFSRSVAGGGVLIASRSGVSTTVEASYLQRFRADVSDSEARLTILGVQRSDHGSYEFSLTDSTGIIGHAVEVVVQFSPKVSNVSDGQSVPEGSKLALFCGASGSPVPNITWTKVFENNSESEVLHRNPTWNIANINRFDAGTYRCTANNGIGNPDSKTLNVDVLYRPNLFKLPSEYKVTVQQGVSLECEADGNPQPSFSWTPCDPDKYVCNNSNLNILEVLDDAVYTCTVRNNLGSDSANTSIVIAGNLINVTLVIRSESYVDGKYNQSVLSKKLNKTMSPLFNGSIYRGISVTSIRSIRSGSLTVDLTLAFSIIVTEKSVLSILREAAKEGKLREFSVDASSIKGTRPVVVTTTTPPISKTTPSVSDDKTWIIVGAVLGSLAAVAVIAGVAFWWVHKKKKNGGKGTKEVGDDDTAGQGQYVRQGPSSAGDGLNNSGYVDAGSASNYANPSGLPPVKPGSKKENKQEKKGKKEVKQKETNQQQALPLYAQVDKSKKTPKAPVNTYDQVERSRKSQPGEVMYTQVEQVNPGRSMPRAAASPVRRPPAYDDTQYAELII